MLYNLLYFQTLIYKAIIVGFNENPSFTHKSNNKLYKQLVKLLGGLTDDKVIA